MKDSRYDGYNQLMVTQAGKYLLAILLPLFTSTFGYAQANDSKRPWKGYAILGNGHLSAVYSDDSRITALTHGEGIQHFYFRDYTADYVSSTSFRLLKENGDPLEVAGTPTVGMKNFFTAQTQTPYTNGISQTVDCFVHPEGAVVLSIAENELPANGRFRFQTLLRKEIKTDQAVLLTSLHVRNNVALARWSNGTVLAIAPKLSSGKITVNGAAVSVLGRLTGEGSQVEMLLIPAVSRAEALSKVKLFQQKDDIEAAAGSYWNSWMAAGQLPAFKDNDAQAVKYLEAYKRNLYCVKSANLNGQLPADITGQFVTNGMPQIYPRDALMCARVLLLTGHAEEAKQLIEFWARPQVPMKTPGEWYARYDAHGKAVDAGSGARFDEPEWTRMAIIFTC